MSDVTASDANLPAASPGHEGASGGMSAERSGPSYLAQGLGAAKLGAGFLKRGDLGLAFAVMFILVVLILPMPAIMLDFLLAISITFSVLVMMTALFIKTPLEFSSFPTILLIATMMRLALNLASTRLILSEGPHRHRRRRRGHRGLRRLRDGRQPRHRADRLRDPRDRELRRHHQGVGPHRGGRGRASRSIRCPASRWRSTPDLSAGLIDEKEAKQRRETLENESSLLRRHGRRVQVRARRRGRGAAHSRPSTSSAASSSA